MKKHYIKLPAFLLLLSMILTSIAVPVHASSKENATVTLDQGQLLGAKFDAAKAQKNLSVKYYKLKNGVVAICKNKNSFAVSLDGTVKFLDNDKSVITKSVDQNACLGAKESCALFFKAPLDQYGNYVRYDSCKKSIKVGNTKYKSYSKKISTTTNMQVVMYNLCVANNSTKKLDVIRVSCLVYDAGGNLAGYSQKYVTCYKSGSSLIENMDYPATCSSPSKIKVLVDCAYKY